jgi:hypothetical protein
MAVSVVLRKMDAARVALAEAKSAPEYKRVADIARAAEEFARRQKLGEGLEIEAHEIVIDALAGLGDVLKREPKATGAAGGGVKNKSRGSYVELRDNNPTLADLGVTKRESMQAQRLARIRDEKPEVFRAIRKSETTANKAIAEEQRQIRHEKTTASTRSAAEKQTPTVAISDAVEWLGSQAPADLLLTDPPYMTDVVNIKEFVRAWLPLALSKLKKTGRAYVFVGAYPEELSAYMACKMPDQILVWTYRNTLGPSPTHDYKQNWQAILYYKMPGAARLDCEKMTEQFSVQDINAPDGRLGDRYHAWQKPIEIAERFIRHATKVGDRVIDPFCCTGTFLLAAAKHHRIGTGCDNNKKNLSIAVERGCVYE